MSEQLQEQPINEQPRARRTSGKQGFASMDVEKQRSIASKGGSSVPAEKRPFARDHSLAAAAGRKGGEASHSARRARKQHEPAH